jgi:hypothetical protein
VIKITLSNAHHRTAFCEVVRYIELWIDFDFAACRIDIPDLVSNRHSEQSGFGVACSVRIDRAFLPGGFTPKRRESDTEQHSVARQFHAASFEILLDFIRHGKCAGLAIQESVNKGLHTGICA